MSVGSAAARATSGSATARAAPPASSSPVSTERLWLTQPRRSTSLANVIRVRGDSFALDRSLFAPTSRAHHHPQPADRGTVWIQGDKRILERVYVKDGVLWHRLRGAVPRTGTAVQCHLDTERREDASRAHTAMHLVMAAFQAADLPALVADPEVKGGRSFRLELATPIPPQRLADALALANGWVGGNKAVKVEHVERAMAAKVLDAQKRHPPDPFPGPADVLDAVRIDGVCTYPCDGTHVDRTAKVGRITIRNAHASGGKFVVVGAVERKA